MPSSRPIHRRWQVVVVGLWMLAFSAAALAQESIPAAEQKPAAATSKETDGPAADRPTSVLGIEPKIGATAGRIQYVGPDTYILLDSQGRPQLVPGMTYEDFLAAWKNAQHQAEPDRLPRYTIESIEITGRTQDGHADLRFTATVHQLADEPAHVALGLVGAILQGQPKFGPPKGSSRGEDDEGSKPNGESRDADRAEEFLTYDPERGGFVAQLAGRKGERRSVSMSLIVPLSRDGAVTMLELGFPRALASNLTLNVDSDIAEPSVNTGTLLAREATEQGGTRLFVVGVAGPFRLSWQSGENGAGDLATVLSTSGAIQVSIDGRSVRSRARLTVQSYGGNFDRFRVRLPPGAQLVQGGSADTDGQQPKYRLTVEQENSVGAAARPADGRQIVLVELPEKQPGPLTIDLSTEQPIGLEAGGTSAELGGFEVIGAVRQFGDVGLDVADDWQARWDIGPNARQVDPAELDAELQHAELTAGFQYDRQPWSLGVRIATRQSRIHVTPDYTLECLPDEARLTVHLTYQLFGARSYEFRVNLEGWEMTAAPIESGGMVDQDRRLVSPDGLLVLPLAQSLSQRAEVTFVVRRALPLEDARVELPLPMPLADSVATGELVVRTAAPVELRPDLHDSKGLVPISSSELTDLGNRDNGVELRYRTVLPDALLVAEKSRQTREVSIDARARIDIADLEARIEQRFEYEVRNEPIDELLFDVPTELSLDDDRFELALLSTIGDGDRAADEIATPLVVSAPPAEFPPNENEAATRIRVPLPQPRSGRFVVRLKYPQQRPAKVSAENKWSLPLVAPADAPATTAQAVVETPPNLVVALNGTLENSSWRMATADSATTAAGSSIEFVADRFEASLPLVLTPVNLDGSSTATVERVWLQSWLSSAGRQDRAAFRFRTSGTQATVELPPRTLPDETDVLVDGRPADVVSRAGGRIVVRLAADSDNRAHEDASVHTLELRWRQPLRRTILARHRLTPPQLVGASVLSQVYWQVVLPVDEHVIRSPARMVAASQWQWLGGFWGRRPVVSQSELEEWAGASKQFAPAPEQNEYLYTGPAKPLTIELITAPRWLIVLVASSSVLAVVLLWIYVPGVRRTWIVGAVACVVAGMAVIFPVPAMLLAQASVLGVVLAMLSALLARLVSTPVRVPLTLSSGSSRQIAPRPDSILMPPVAATASTAPTTALRIPDSDR